MRCKEHGFCALFLLKFHLELNLIKECWYHVKLMYCEFLLLKEAIMHSYVVDTLNSISLKHIQL